MTQPPSSSVPNPDLSELMDKSAEEWSAPEIQSAARSALQTHAPDREPLTWIKRFGVVPWLHRNDAVCRECGGTYPCITHRYATQLLSAGRIPNTCPEKDAPTPPKAESAPTEHRVCADGWPSSCRRNDEGRRTGCE